MAEDESATLDALEKEAKEFDKVGRFLGRSKLEFYRSFAHCIYSRMQKLTVGPWVSIGRGSLILI